MRQPQDAPARWASSRTTRWSVTLAVVVFIWTITWSQVPLDSAAPAPVEQVGIILLAGGPAGMVLAAILGTLPGRRGWAAVVAWVLTVVFAGYLTFVAGLVSFTSGDLLCGSAGHSACYTGVGPRLLGLAVVGVLCGSLVAFELWVARRRGAGR